MIKVLFRVMSIPLVAMMMFFGGISPVSAVTSDSHPNSPVIDEGNMFSPDEEATLVKSIAANHETYGLSFVVETIPSLDGQNLEETALKHANSLGIGDSGRNNGVLILLARDDRKVRFELGSGVTGKVSDSDMTRIIDRVVTPEFKSGAYLAGVEAGMVSVGKKYNGITTDLDDDIYAVIAAVFLGVGLGAFLIVFFVKKLKEKPSKKYNSVQRTVKTLDKIKSYISGFRYTPEAKHYQTLPNAEARFNYLEANQPELANLLKKNAPDEAHPTSIVDRVFYDNTNGIPFRYDKKSGRSALPSSLLYFMLLGKGFGDMSIDAANGIIRAEKAKAEKIREKEQKKKERVRKIWDAIPAPTQKALRKAKTQNERMSLLTGKVASDFSANYSMMTAMFLSSSSDSSYSSKSSHSGSSSSSSSNSSSSSTYSPPSSFDSGSFGGGSFDGGGGSGSW